MSRVCYYLVIFHLVFCGRLAVLAAAEVDQDKVYDLVNEFCEDLKTQDLEGLQKHLAEGIQIRKYSSDEIKVKVDSLILNKISAMEYLQVITGLNVFRFVEIYAGKKWVVVGSPEIERNIYRDQTMSAGKSRTYYFVKIKLQIKETSLQTPGAIRELSKSAEIDILTDEAEYRIFGFII